MSWKKWLCIFLTALAVLLTAVAATVYILDPFVHFHKPNGAFFYTLNNQRSQNDGLLRNLDYDAIITGTSMTDNFKTSEADTLFGVTSVKVTSDAGTFREINDTVEKALKAQPELKLVIRSLDRSCFTDSADTISYSQAQYPDYLYNDDPFDDVKYLFNYDVVFQRCLPMLRDWAAGEPGGITSFDDYCNWMGQYGGSFGGARVMKNRGPYVAPETMEGLSSEESEAVLENVRLNVTYTALAHPDTEFYYFIPPYSAVWWADKCGEGYIRKSLEAQRIIVEEILKCDNIRLFEYDTCTELTTDLDNYRDSVHYGDWINSRLLRCMLEGEGLVTTENYREKLTALENFYGSFDYNSLFGQAA